MTHRIEPISSSRTGAYCGYCGYGIEQYVNVGRWWHRKDKVAPSLAELSKKQKRGRKR